VEHHLTRQNAQPGHRGAVWWARSKQQNKTRTGQLEKNNVDAFRAGVFVFSFFFLCDMSQRSVICQTKRDGRRSRGPAPCRGSGGKGG
jgi:hypothetical protein